MIFLTILLVPLLCTFVGFIISGIIKKQKAIEEIESKKLNYLWTYKEEEITWGELAIQIGVNLIIVGLFVGIISCQNLIHTEIWNGRVVSKEREKVSCRHSYDCNCRTVCSGSGKNRSCHTVCDTCYEHSYDVDWIIEDNTGHIFNIATKDRQGLLEPEFWTQARVGDPTAHKHMYKNYIKASPGSLFRKQGLLEKYKDILSRYPNKIFRYYNLDRIVSVGVKIDNLEKWNKELAIVNSKVGVQKECNAIIVIVKNQPREYLYALEQYWVGGNKNDAILVISVTDDGTIMWADSIALVQESLFKVILRDNVEAVGTIKHMDKIINRFYVAIMGNYKRKEMKNFKYLSAIVTPTATQYTVAILISTIISICLSIYFHKEDVI